MHLNIFEVSQQVDFLYQRRPDSQHGLFCLSKARDSSASHLEVVQLVGQTVLKSRASSDDLTTASHKPLIASWCRLLMMFQVYDITSKIN